MAVDDGFLANYRTPPEEKVADTQTTGTEGTPPATETTATTEQTTGVQTPDQAQTTKPDEFINTFNQRFSSSFKADDEIKSVLGLQQKIGEYETKAKLADDYAQKIEDYEKQLENLKNNDSSVFLEKPLIRQAYVAQQLLEKYPDKDPETLRQIVMSDVDKMGDLDVLVKNQKVNHPRLAESDIKAVLSKKYGIDTATDPTEWDSIARTEIAMDAETARASIKSLTTGIELPKTVTKEQRDLEASANLKKRVETTAPFKADFITFDKFKRGNIDFDVPAPVETKNRLSAMFDAMFIESGMEPTPENLQTAKDMRDGQFLLDNFEKIIEIEVKKGQTEIQKKLDEALHNTQPPNTKTATDEGNVKSDLPGPGLSKFLEDNGR